jgi:3-oxoacyl-[acyl-carrier-protein] synthase III
MLEAPAPLTAAPGRKPALRPAAIASVAMAVPERIVSNEPIAARFGIEPGWIVERTGVRERRYLADGEELVTLAASAAERALARAGIDADAVDQVLAATMSHERLTPNLAPLVADRIGSAAGAFDVGAACTGFVDALAMAVGQVESGRAETVLVLAAERLSAITDHDDRATAALFGDGAGAVIVRPAHGAGIGPFALGSDGARAEIVRAERAEGLIRMQGHDTFREAVNRMAQATVEAVDAAGLDIAEIDVFVYHQANARILRSLAQRLRLDEERVLECISRFGNTSAASIPIALASAIEEGRIEPGARVLLAAFGGGLTWGATVVEWEAPHGD